MAQFGKAEELADTPGTRRWQREAEAWLRAKGAAAVEAVTPAKGKRTLRVHLTNGLYVLARRNRDGSVSRYLHARLSWLGCYREKGLGRWPCDLIAASRAVYQLRLDAARANDVRRANDPTWGVGGPKSFRTQWRQRRRATIIEG
jgi:hypothetical protein